MKTFIICLMTLLVATSGFAQWEYGGIEISGNNMWTADLTAISDGEGGVFVAWRYYPHQFDPDIFVQHLDSAGHELWPHEGVDAVIEPHGQYTPQLALDDSGGVYISWVDVGRNGGNYNIYAQRLNALGERLWGDSGLAVNLREGFQYAPLLMIPDGEGGAILGWTDWSDTVRAMVQRIDGQGQLYWGQYGMGLTNPRYATQVFSGLLRSLDGNLIACWVDYRSQGAGPGIYAQKFTVDGELLWDTLGIPVAVYPYSLEEISYEASSIGGFYALWTGELSRGVFVQYIDETGVARFGPAGTSLSSDWYCYNPKLKMTGDNEVFVAWMNQLGTDHIYANLIDTLGTRWPENRIIGTNTDALYSLIQSNPGEFVFSSNMGFPNLDFRAFKYSLTEGHQWGDTGIMIGPPNHSGYRPEGVTDMVGGSIFVWQYGEGYSVFANRVYPNGWVVPDTTDAVWQDDLLPEAVRISNYPNPFNASTMISITGLNGKEVEIRIYDLEGRLIDKLFGKDGRVVWHAVDNNMQPLSSGIYFARIMHPSLSQTLKMIYLK